MNTTNEETKFIDILGKTILVLLVLIALVSLGITVYYAAHYQSITTKEIFGRGDMKATCFNGKEWYGCSRLDLLWGLVREYLYFFGYAIIVSFVYPSYYLFAGYGSGLFIFLILHYIDKKKTAQTFLE